MPDGDDGEEIKARDVVPTPTDLHANQERFTIQWFEHLVEQLSRDPFDGTALDTAGWPTSWCKHGKEPSDAENPISASRMVAEFCKLTP